jgi:medium-chain acyl-[acyl-carrier-protein] hydrolase
VVALKIFQRSAAKAEKHSEIRRRLFCFPYAGAGAAIFRTWPDLLPADVELCVPGLPGRDAEIGKPPVAEMTSLVDLLSEQIVPRLALPYALFGHSMGAFVAFDLAHEILRRNLRPPSHLFVAAQRGARLPYPEKPIFDLPEESFLSALVARYDSIPKAIMEQAEFMKLLLPTLRADITLVEDYRYRAAGPLGCPIIVFGGLEDRRVNRSQLEAWSVETSARCSMHLLPGGHFFLNSARAELLAQICRELNS